MESLFREDDLLPLSALQHLLFCARQCALIHVEGLWAENALTIEGRHLHEKTHSGPSETRRGTRITRGMPLRSLRLGLIGQADTVEFVRDGTGSGHVTPFPVEYKRGKPKGHRADEVQLCAQGLCLEEMLQTPVPRGALFYGKTRRRMEVEFDPTLRDLTEDAAFRLHELIASGITPRAIREPKCDRCSLLNLCLPDALSPTRSAEAYLRRSLTGLESPEDLPVVQPRVDAQ